MLTFTLPSMAVQKVTNGYVVHWTKPDKNGKQRIPVEAIASTNEDLLAVIELAASDLAV